MLFRSVFSNCIRADDGCFTVTPLPLLPLLSRGNGSNDNGTSVLESAVTFSIEFIEFARNESSLRCSSEAYVVARSLVQVPIEVDK